METILITSENVSDLERIIEFAKALKAKTKKLNVTDMEDAELLKVMDVNRVGDYVSENNIFATINKQKKVLANEG